MEFASGIQTKRTSCGHSQKEVAEHLNITQQSLSKWEKGISRPSIENTLRLLHFYRCSDEEMIVFLKGTLTEKIDTKQPSNI
ncbi:helix-turn-helix domain-containing protein [Listeria seeligeri]|uniref:helix-turn-helix domain-containing protein n=1 Tax=Listeria seeligeri TaxID=1640 RepID=UPI0016252E59|nr:helix-turn-helix transcriptional regulator [Listeria seeligeri]MBC1537728.1 helix-turn-helix transcriptional regulator [Listeria seeligeri]MBC1555041.1 helix-turn-helix transcriptional regulator [Listeria seeligeri]MBC6121716.1 helix-turn-helix transcriptional regulator [Listeria seeligeri]